MKKAVMTWVMLTLAHGATLASDKVADDNAKSFRVLLKDKVTSSLVLDTVLSTSNAVPATSAGNASAAALSACCAEPLVWGEVDKQDRQGAGYHISLNGKAGDRVVLSWNVAAINEAAKGYCLGKGGASSEGAFELGLAVGESLEVASVERQSQSKFALIVERVR